MSITIDKILAAQPTTERGRPTQLSADPKGERIAYASGKSVFLRSIDDPSLSKQYISHTTTTTVARFSPSGYYIASGDVSGTVKIWDAVEGKNTKGEYHIISGRINDIAWDGDSQRLAAVGDGREKYGHFITADSGNSVGEISGHSGVINSVSIRQQRPLRAATGSDDSTIVFMNGAPFKFANKLGGLHKGYIYGVGFSPDGENLVSVGADRRIQLYDGKTGDTKKHFGDGEHKGSIFAVSWARDSKRLVTASADQTVKLWDVETGKSVQTWHFEEGNVSIPDHQVGVVWPAGRNDSMIISLSLSGNLNYLIEGTQKPAKVIQGHTKAITAFGSTRNEKSQTFWTGSFDGRVCSWDASSGIGSVVDGQSHTNQITAFTSSPNRAHSVGWDDTLRVIDRDTNIFVGEASKLSAQPKGIASADGRMFVATATGIDTFVKDNLVSSLAFDDSTPVSIAAFGSLLAVGDNANIVHLYTVDASHKLVPKEKLTKSTDWITALSFSPTGSLLAVGNSKGKIYVYDTKTGEIKTDRWGAHTARVMSIAWNDEGTLAVSGGLDTNIFVWSLKSPGKRVKALNAHKDGVYGVCWFDGGKKVASAGGRKEYVVTYDVHLHTLTSNPGTDFEKLSTANSQNHDNIKMSSLGSSDAPTASPSRKPRYLKRGKLRNGTFILPGTGERVRRQITLRNTPGFDNTYGNDSDGSIDRQPSMKGAFQTAVDKATTHSKEFWGWLHTPVAKGIFKCSLAYLIGSMGTFLPLLANFLGHQDGKHMVATITVYFHPARSAGSMEEAAMLGIAAFCYAVFISVSSMAVSVFCETQLGIIELGQRFNGPLTGVFSNDKIIQVMKMVIIGITSTSAVSLLIWPVSARAELREAMIKATDSLGDMLTMITQGFLSGSETELLSPSFRDASSRYRSVFARLTESLKEAKLEHLVLGTEEQYHLEARLVNCMQRLSQSIGGLRSAASTQFSLIKEPAEHGSGTPVDSIALTTSHMLGGSDSPLSGPKQDRFEVLTAIEEASEDGNGDDDRQTNPFRGMKRQGTDTSLLSLYIPTARTTSDIFERFIRHLGPSMKSLSYTLSQILNELPFGAGPEYQISINEHFETSLTDALMLYTTARSDALKELYKSKELDKTRPECIEADFEEVAASCGQFSFSLQDFANEMQTFLSILEELKIEIERSKRRSWKWLHFWRLMMPSGSTTAIDPEREHLIGQPRDNIIPKDLPEEVKIGQRDVNIRTIEEEQAKRQRLYRGLLRVARFFERDDIRFAVKVGVGAALYALFAFIPATRPYYAHFRGEWGLLSYMLVCSMTIGASNTTGWARFIGTFIGAILAVITWVTCQGNAFALAFCGWLVSLPCFYLIVAKGQGPFGRFIMLTYNLSCLYAYSLSIKDGDNDEDEGGVTPVITEIAFHRVVAVFGGVLWGLIITRLIWPISARRKFKNGLTLLWLRMGLIWRRDPLSTLLEGESPNAYINFREECALQRYVSLLDKLRGAASSELELRGPFPNKAYGRIIESTNKMLDAFHSMNVVIQKDLNVSEGEAILLKYTADERAQLCARISHLFQARDEDYEILYVYTLVTGQIAEEIKKVEREIEDLFGIMDEDVLKLR
ncbi:hypothetical protein B7494_g2290 [Chlorociboria aeruginascens]|nr:hypothetical protein B7494_g2290 [Chlorociboria aeruginascens]